MTRLLCAAAALVLLAIPAMALASTSASPTEEPCPAEDTDNGLNHVYITRVETKAPQTSTWINNVNGPVCAELEYDTETSVALQWLWLSEAELPPPGTGIRVTLKSEELAPLYTVGDFTHGESQFNGDEVIVSGYLFYAGLPAYVDDSCEPGERDPIWLAQIVLDGGGLADEAYRGSYFATDAVQVVPRVIENGKAISLNLDGCGDSDPNTADGFFEGFIPEAAATALGITPALVESLTPEVAGQLVQVDNNGQPTTAGMSLEAVPGGLFLRYALSFSKHHIKMRANHKAIALSRHCKKTGGRLEVKRVRHKHRQSRLVCVR
jgi:hypothetical protein